MKTLMIGSTIAGLILMPLAANTSQTEPTAANPGQNNQSVPPISQQLVPEADLAVQLATALKLGSPKTRDEAESIEDTHLMHQRNTTTF